MPKYRAAKIRQRAKEISERSDTEKQRTVHGMLLPCLTFFELEFVLQTHQQMVEFPFKCK
jgi:hypothetical protein